MRDGPCKPRPYRPGQGDVQCDICPRVQVLREWYAPSASHRSDRLRLRQQSSFYRPGIPSYTESELNLFYPASVKHGGWPRAPIDFSSFNFCKQGNTTFRVHSGYGFLTQEPGWSSKQEAVESPLSPADAIPSPRYSPTGSALRRPSRLPYHPYAHEPYHRRTLASQVHRSLPPARRTRGYAACR